MELDGFLVLSNFPLLHERHLARDRKKLPLDGNSKRYQGKCSCHLVIVIPTVSKSWMITLLNHEEKMLTQ